LKSELSAAFLLSIAVVLLQYGIRFIESGRLLYGVVLVLAAIALMAITVLLISLGVIEKAKKVMRSG